MNKGLAHIIRDRLIGIPFVDLYAGLVSTQTQVEVRFRPQVDETEDLDTVGTRYDLQYPVSCDVVGNVTCDENNNPLNVHPMTPNSTKTGILYFEDEGITDNGSSGSQLRFNSRLRLVVWLNTLAIDSLACWQVSMPVQVGIIERLKGDGNPFSDESGYQAIDIRIAGFPRTAFDIFGKYTYNEADTQFTMAPYEYFAIDLDIDFRINPYCVPYLNTQIPDPCLR